MEHIYLISYFKDGKPKSYQIPAINEWNALVRLGQIHGDRADREDIEINVMSIKQTTLLGKAS